MNFLLLYGFKRRLEITAPACRTIPRQHTPLTLIDGRQADVVVEELAELHQEHGVARVRVADVVVERGGDLAGRRQRSASHGPLAGAADTCRRTRETVVRDNTPVGNLMNNGKREVMCCDTSDDGMG